MADPADAALFTQNFTSAADLGRSGERLRQLFMGQRMQQGQAQEQRAQQQFDMNREAFTREQTDAEAQRMVGLFKDFYGPWARDAIKSGDYKSYVAASLRNPGFRKTIETHGIFDDLSALDPNDPELEQELQMLAAFGEQWQAQAGPKIGNYNPGDYTPESWAEVFGMDGKSGSGDVRALKRYQSPQRDPNPPSGYMWGPGGTLAPVPGGPADPKGPRGQTTDFTRADKLRDEYNAQSKDFITIADNYAAMQQVAADPSAAGDLSLIFSYMKLLDPGSVVREQEFANAQNAGGVPDRVRAAWNKALAGERLSENQRADFLKQADTIYRSKEKRHNATIRKRYEEQARRWGLNPDDVVGALAIDEQKPQTPAVDVNVEDLLNKYAPR